MTDMTAEEIIKEIDHGDVFRDLRAMVYILAQEIVALKERVEKLHNEAI